jgi:hypothetical protein
MQPPAGILEQMLTVRVHLDDCNPANGPLRVLPGSHQEGRLSDAAIGRWKQRQPVPCWVGRGGLVLLRPLCFMLVRAERPSHRRVIPPGYLRAVARGIALGMKRTPPPRKTRLRG